MRDVFQRILAFFSNMSKRTRNILIASVAVLIIAIVAISLIASNSGYEVAFSGLTNAAEKSEMIAELTALGYSVRSDDTSISVRKGEKDQAIVAMNAKGYPKQGLIYDTASGMGATDAERIHTVTMQLQENLARTLQTFEKVEQATVYITLANEGNYVLNRDKRAATASVILRLQNQEPLTTSEATAVAELVSKAVEGLEPEQVAISDTQMNIYTLDNSDANLSGDRLALQTMVEDRFTKRIQQFLQPIFGVDGVSIAVNAVLDFDNTTTESVVFSSPNDDGEGIAVSSSRLWEIVRSDENGDIVGFDPNGAADVPSYPEIAADPGAYYAQVSEETNYEVNSVRTLIEAEKGKVRDLSIAVVIDSVTNANTLTYLTDVQNLVANALGIDGVYVGVRALPFKEASDSMDALQQEQEEALARSRNASLIRQLIWAALILVIAILAFFVVMRMLRNRRQEVIVTPEGVDILVGDEDDEAGGMDFIQETQDPTLAQLEEYVDSSPESVAQLLRNWLSNE